MCRVTRANTIRVQDETIREFFRDKYVYIQGVHELLYHCNKRAVLYNSCNKTSIYKNLEQFFQRPVVYYFINNVMQFQEQSSFASALITLIFHNKVSNHSQGCELFIIRSNKRLMKRTVEKHGRSYVARPSSDCLRANHE